jgi:hypothetical protein
MELFNVIIYKKYLFKGPSMELVLKEVVDAIHVLSIREHDETVFYENTRLVKRQLLSTWKRLEWKPV